MVSELGVETIRVDDDDKLPRYIGGVMARLQEVWVGRQIAEVKSKLQRMSPIEQGDNTTPCSATSSRWRPTGAACSSRQAETGTT